MTRAVVANKTRRSYHSPRRADGARRTRRAIVAAATVEFERHGYPATTIPVVASAAGVSTATVEQAFGRKIALFKEVIDIAIAGDDAPVAMLDRPWAAAAVATAGVEDLLAVFARQLGVSMRRSARLVHAAFEAASVDAELDELAGRLATNRRVVAAWLVDAVRHRIPLRAGLRRGDAVDTIWLLMEPAAFVRLTRYRGWSGARYARWFATTAQHALVADGAGPVAST